MTKNQDVLESDRGAAQRDDRHEQMVVSLTSRDLSDLAARALSRLSDATGAGDVSKEAKACMKYPLATALATALCDDMSDIADLMVSDLIDAGVSVEDVCLNHLAPAARCLGEWWEKDRLPFTEVAMATSRIQSLLRRMPASRMNLCATGRKGAVFCAVPGEQHTLGVMMAADLFRRNGWDVALLLGLDHRDIMDRLERDDRTVIGLSCSSVHAVGALERVITALRERRPDATIILSGQVVKDADALARLPRPDAIVSDMAEATECMERLAEAPAPRPPKAVAIA